MAKIAAIELGKKLNTSMETSYQPYANKSLRSRQSFTEKDSHVIPGLIYRLNKNINSKEFEIWGSGKPLQEFLYVLDLAECIKYIIESKLDEDLINVGSGEEISIKDLAMLISEILNYKEI